MADPTKEVEKKPKKKGGIKKFFRCLLLGLVILLAGLFIFHQCKVRADFKFLQEKGYYNPVSAGEYSLNTYRFGKENGEHRIVVIAGMGSGFALDIRRITAGLQQENDLIFIARAGWDGSEDSRDERSVQQIVEDYRNVLKNAGIPAPYVLMAHSIGGAYGSYWVSKYPEEIEAFVNIDGTYVTPQEDTQEQSDGSAILLKAAVNFGIGDLFLHAFYPKEEAFTAEEQRVYDFMLTQSMASDGANKEGAVVARNLNEINSVLTVTDVPKLYISARDGYQTKEDILNGPGLDDWDLDHYAPDFQGTEVERRDAACANWLAQCQENRDKELFPYLEKMGNCTVEYIPGSHFIYETEPERTAEVIENFINGL